MKRIHLFEFEDFAWFPSWIRNCMTRFIVVMHRILGSSEQLATLLAEALPYSNSHTIIDMCSGDGGPMPEVAKILREQHGFEDLKVSLSDLYPNKTAAKTINEKNDPLLTYVNTPVNATNIGVQQGLRTMVCSLHHMKPAIAKGILRDAQQAKQPICIFEISDNSSPKWIWWIAIPINFLMVFFVTPMIRPMTWQQLVFTYLIPIIPLAIAWDGAVSNARTYTLSDLDELLVDLQSPDYEWKKGVLTDKPGKKVYLMGLPKK